MKRILTSLVAIAALGALAHVTPASACETQQKTTMTKAEKAQVEKAQRSNAVQSKKDANAQKPDDSRQARNVAATARGDQK